MIEPGLVMLGDDVLAKTGLALEEMEYSLDGFEMEVYEVTNQRYSLCVSAGVCTPPNGSFDAVQDAFKPVAQVTVKQAMMFCAWIDRRLPSEIEWERAARYTDFRTWPWGGDTPPSDDLHAILTYELFPNNLVFTRDVGVTVEGASEEGVFDLIGNVWEWTCTPMDSSPEDCWFGQVDEHLPASFVIRGGGANIPPNPSLVSAYRQPADWDFNQNRFLGFRCVDVP
jgi:formylglycine-generating enzyme required for sulfatase activity